MYSLKQPITYLSISLLGRPGEFKISSWFRRFQAQERVNLAIVSLQVNKWVVRANEQTDKPARTRAHIWLSWVVSSIILKEKSLRASMDLILLILLAKGDIHLSSNGSSGKDDPSDDSSMSLRSYPPFYRHKKILL